MKATAIRRWPLGRSGGGAAEGSTRTSPINAASPRPSRLLPSSAITPALAVNVARPNRTRSGCFQLAFALNYLGRELQVRLAPGAFEVVQQHRLAMRRRLGHAYVSRDNGLVDRRPHVCADVRHDLNGEAVAAVVH